MHQILSDVSWSVVAGWLLAALVIFIGACLQGVSGVGLGMVASPVLVLLHPELVPGPLLFLACALSVMAVLRERRAIDRSGLGLALLGRLLTSGLAAFAIGVLPIKALSITFALLILAAVALSLTPLKFYPTRPALFLAGSVSGFMGTITSVGLPPMALVYQNARPDTLRASLAGFLAVGSVFSMGALAAVGRFGWTEMLLGAFLLLPLSLGFAVSSALVQRTKSGMIRSMALGLSALAALLLLARQLAV